MWPHRRRARPDGPPGAEGVRARRPQPALLRREQRTLLRVREQKLRDLGGLLVEQYRRGSFRDDLLAQGCAELVGIDARLSEIDELLHPRGRVPRCSCGAAVLHGSHFCPNCGRVLDAPARGAEDTAIAKGNVT